MNAATSGTTTTLASSINPSTVSQVTSLTATVTGGSPTPTGTVTFYEGATVLGSVAVGPSGQAVLSAPQLASVYAIGTHTLTAQVLRGRQPPGQHVGPAHPDRRLAGVRRRR